MEYQNADAQQQLKFNELMSNYEEARNQYSNMEMIKSDQDRQMQTLNSRIQRADKKVEILERKANQLEDENNKKD